LQEGRENANIDAGLGFIWRISAKTARQTWACLVMQWIAVLVAILVASPALAERNRATANMRFHVSTDGDDSADCVTAPCRTIQRAYIVVMNDWDFAGHQPYIKLAPGVYQGVKATGQAIGSHVVNIVGQQSSDLAESCDYSQADQVTVESAEADAVFDIQDLALLIVRCLRVRAPNGAGFLVRQTPVSDIAHIIFDVLRFGVIAKENGAINLGGTMWLSNSMTVFFDIRYSVPDYCCFSYRCAETDQRRLFCHGLSRGAHQFLL
jgi:hypothetical protein